MISDFEGITDNFNTEILKLETQVILMTNHMEQQPLFCFKHT